MKQTLITCDNCGHEQKAGFPDPVCIVVGEGWGHFKSVKQDKDLCPDCTGTVIAALRLREPPKPAAEYTPNVGDVVGCAAAGHWLVVGCPPLYVVRPGCGIGDAIQWTNEVKPTLVRRATRAELDACGLHGVTP